MDYTIMVRLYASLSSKNIAKLVGFTTADLARYAKLMQDEETLKASLTDQERYQFFNGIDDATDPKSYYHWWCRRNNDEDPAMGWFDGFYGSGWGRLNYRLLSRGLCADVFRTEDHYHSGKTANAGRIEAILRNQPARYLARPKTQEEHQEQSYYFEQGWHGMYATALDDLKAAGLKVSNINNLYWG